MNLHHQEKKIDMTHRQTEVKEIVLYVAKSLSKLINLQCICRKSMNQHLFDVVKFRGQQKSWLSI